MQPVTIYRPNELGNLAVHQVISAKELSDKMWLDDGIDPGNFRPPEPDQDYGKANCKECDREFKLTRKGQLFCKGPEGSKSKNACYNAYHNRKVRVGEVQHSCLRCEKPFMGTPSRRYCNDPCVHHVNRKPGALPDFVDCKFCLKPFKPKTRKVKFCHNPCNFEMYRANHHKPLEMKGVL